jgi:hypothetical protein
MGSILEMGGLATAPARSLGELWALNASPRSGSSSLRIFQSVFATAIARCSDTLNPTVYHYRAIALVSA